MKGGSDMNGNAPRQRARFKILAVLPKEEPGTDRTGPGYSKILPSGKVKWLVMTEKQGQVSCFDEGIREYVGKEEVELEYVYNERFNDTTIYTPRRSGAGSAQAKFVGRQWQPRAEDPRPFALGSSMRATEAALNNLTAQGKPIDLEAVVGAALFLYERIFEGVFGHPASEWRKVMAEVALAQAQVTASAPALPSKTAPEALKPGYDEQTGYEEQDQPQKKIVAPGATSASTDPIAGLPPELKGKIKTAQEIFGGKFVPKDAKDTDVPF